MEPLLTYEQLMNLFIETRNQIKEQSAEFNKNLEKSIEKSRKEFEEEIKRSRKEFDEEIKRSRELSEKENAKLSQQIGRLGGTWGRFVEEMIQPRIVEMFQEKGIAIEMSARSVKAVKDSNIYYEIDILLVNTNVAVAIEVKSTLSIEDINEHIERLDKIKQVAPKLFNLSGMIIYGAVAGIIIEREADKYAYKKGLFVIRQKGNIVEIANDSKFIPKEWKVEY
jgi:hypothetical protein